jgi:hypothetical protein
MTRTRHGLAQESGLCPPLPGFYYPLVPPGITAQPAVLGLPPFHEREDAMTRAIMTAFAVVGAMALATNALAQATPTTISTNASSYKSCVSTKNKSPCWQTASPWVDPKIAIAIPSCASTNGISPCWMTKR